LDIKEEDEQIGKRIKEVRQKIGLTQEELGERAELHYSYIGQLERGNKLPSIKTLKKIAAALNIKLEALLEDVPTYETSSQNLLNREILNILKDSPPEDLKLFLDVICLVKDHLQKIRRKTKAKG